MFSDMTVCSVQRILYVQIQGCHEAAQYNCFTFMMHLLLCSCFSPHAPRKPSLLLTYCGCPHIKLWGPVWGHDSEFQQFWITRMHCFIMIWVTMTFSAAVLRPFLSCLCFLYDSCRWHQSSSTFCFHSDFSLCSILRTENINFHLRVTFESFLDGFDRK